MHRIPRRYRWQAAYCICICIWIGDRLPGWLVAAFYAPFGMFIVNLLDSILSLKQMLHFTSGSSACQR